MLDNLKMTYTGNRLTKAENLNLKTSSTYTYDVNGNMKKDSGKGITNIKYNYLNLPAELAMSKTSGDVTNKYVYTADGRKLRVNKGTDETNYCGNVIYENGKFKRLLVEGGYYQDGKYHYFIKDHLGNTRLVGDQDASISQTTQYYPFGKMLAHRWDGSGQSYLYNGKELDQVNGLDLYDYGARHMDTQIGRFTTMDPLAEKYYHISPYAYCANNPVNRIDPTGEDWKDFLNGIVDGAKNRVSAMGNAVAHPIETAKQAYTGFMQKSIDEKILSVVDLYAMGGISSNTELFSAIASDLNGGDGSATGEFIGGTAVNVAVAAAGVKAGNVVSKGISKGIPTTKGGLVNLTEETFSQALSKGAENIGNYSIYGTKGLVGNTYNRNIFLIEASGNKSLSGFRKLIGNMESEAIKQGANKISIYGSSVINKGFLNPNVAKRFGYSFENSGSGVFMQKSLKP